MGLDFPARITPSTSHTESSSPTPPLPIPTESNPTKSNPPPRRSGRPITTPHYLQDFHLAMTLPSRPDPTSSTNSFFILCKSTTSSLEDVIEDAWASPDVIEDTWASPSLNTHHVSEKNSSKRRDPAYISVDMNSQEIVGEGANKTINVPVAAVPKVLPFEFRALDACLESACRCLECETLSNVFDLKLVHAVKHYWFICLNPNTQCN
ncbi:hypothetical protein SADUNF_Sadunf05G0044500 [Salix dunnii]|uniref:Uncharacterized protein n=1 Tax=Salix dunnii TaxID=1413687 RepID=A0A835K9H8_9ROSI|nr:hypothetical protein SADUNF_Sadunf05G0044500 [Salix dunnii]